jgi:uncharacterized MAPEG superfamily protein
MLSFAATIFDNLVKPNLHRVPVYYTLEGSVIAMFMLLYLSKYVQVFLSFILLRKYDNVQSSHRYGPSKLSVEADKEWKVKAVSRAYSAHSNHWEAFISFSVAVIFAILKAAPSDRQELTILANAFLIQRVAYNAAYVLAFNEPLSFIRSSIFMLGWAIIVRIFVISIKEITV